MQRLGAVLIVVVMITGCAREDRSARDAMVPVPDVRGLRLIDGAMALQELGLCVLVEQGSGPERRPIVVAQSPSPGHGLRQGALVAVVIDTPEDVLSMMKEIGAANEALDCSRGSGIGGLGGTAT